MYVHTYRYRRIHVCIHSIGSYRLLMLVTSFVQKSQDLSVCWVFVVVCQDLVFFRGFLVEDLYSWIATEVREEDEEVWNALVDVAWIAGMQDHRWFAGKGPRVPQVEPLWPKNQRDPEMLMASPMANERWPGGNGPPIEEVNDGKGIGKGQV